MLDYVQQYSKLRYDKVGFLIQKTTLQLEIIAKSKII